MRKFAPPVMVGTRAALILAKSRRVLTSVFAGVIFAVAIYMLGHTGLSLRRAARDPSPHRGEVRTPWLWDD